MAVQHLQENVKARCINHVTLIFGRSQQNESFQSDFQHRLKSQKTTSRLVRKQTLKRMPSVAEEEEEENEQELINAILFPQDFL